MSRGDEPVANLTIREFFVKGAMEGLLANPDSLRAVMVMAKEQDRDPGEVHAHLVCGYVDAQLAELEKGKDDG